MWVPLKNSDRLSFHSVPVHPCTQMNSASLATSALDIVVGKWTMCVFVCVGLCVCLCPYTFVMSILKVLLALTLSDVAEISLGLPCHENSVYLVARETCFFSAGHSGIYSIKQSYVFSTMTLGPSYIQSRQSPFFVFFLFMFDRDESVRSCELEEYIRQELIVFNSTQYFN